MSTHYLIQWLLSYFFFFFICLWHCSLLASWNFLLVFCDSKFFWLSCCLWVFFPPPKSQLPSSLMDFPGGASGKEPACQCTLAITDMSLIPGSGRSPGGGHSNPLQYSCLENPKDRGARQTAAHGVTQSGTRLKWCSMHVCFPSLVLCPFHFYIILLWSHSFIISTIIICWWYLNV